MRTRSTKPPRGVQHRNSSSVTAIPLASSRHNKNKANSPIEPELLSEDLAKLQTRIAQLPDFDAARIVEIHDRIISGEYKVDSKSLADKLQKFEADL